MNSFLLLSGLVGALFFLQRSHTKPPRRSNPTTKRRSNPANDDSLEAAKALSLEFHGNTDHILVLSEEERQLPKYVVELGAMPEMSYAPENSKRAGSVWEHKAGDRGILRKASKHKPLLAARPDNRRPIIVPLRSPIRFNEERGLVG